MPWYLRKSFRAGPIRFNLSKSGLGASVGVRGLRVGTGPRGAYIAGGRGGLYYRQYFNTTAPPHTRTTLPVPIYEPDPSDTVATEQVGQPVPGDALAHEIKTRLHAPRYGSALIIGAFVFGLGLLIAGHGFLGFVAFLAIFALGVTLIRKESEARKIAFEYDEHDPLVTEYRAFIDGFRDAAQCAAIWRVTTAASSHDVKYTAGAGTLINRAPTRIAFDNSAVTANLTLASVAIGGGQLFFLPERMLYIDKTTVMSLDYQRATVVARTCDFREHALVPSDARRIGRTWQYVNKSGAPDLRFAHNPQIPIVQYGELLFAHPQMTFHLQFSRANIGESLARGFDAFKVHAPRIATN